MKILVLSNLFPPGFIGGYELGAYDVAKGLQAKGHHVKVLTSDYFQDDGTTGIDLDVERSLQCVSLAHELFSPDPFIFHYYNFHNIRVIGYAIRRFRPDVVLAFNLHGLGAITIIQFLQRLQVPLVLYLMDNILSGIDHSSSLHSTYERVFGRFHLSASTRVVAMSRNVESEVKLAMMTTFEDVDFIPGWVQLEALGKRELKYRRKGTTRFVFCSRVAPHKGTDIMLSAAHQLVQQGHLDFMIDVYGAGQVAQFMQNVQSLGLDRHVEYKGVLPKQAMLPTLTQYDALLFPTWEREPFGFVASEAAAAGALPVVTVGTGASEWFLDGIDSLKISRNADSLRAAMSQIIFWTDEQLLGVRTAAMNAGWDNFEFSAWLKLIEDRCAQLAEQWKGQTDATVRRVESAFLLLSTLLKESSRA